MLGFEDFQETPLRFVAVLPSLNVPLAVNFIDVPFEMRGFAGSTVIETSLVVETVSPADPETAPNVAVMVVLPVAALLAKPWPLMPAAAALDELQTTEPLMSCVLESLNVPVAVNCFVVPTAMLDPAGVTASETSVAPVTVSDAVPLTDPSVAVIVVVPVPVLVAKPVESMLAAFDEEDQVSDVSICVLPSSKLPTAVNCKVVPSAMDGVAGETAIETRCAGTTVSVVVSVNAPTVAVMVVDPAARVVANPEASIVAAAGEDEVQFTPVARSWLDPSL